MDEATAHRRLGILAVEDRLVKRKGDEQARWLTEELFEDVCPDTKIMYAIEELGGLATTGEVASQTCFTEPAIAGRLRDLEDDGVLISGGPGGSIDVETSPRVSLPVVSKEKEAVFYWALTSSRA